MATNPPWSPVANKPKVFVVAVKLFSLRVADISVQTPKVYKPIECFFVPDGYLGLKVIFVSEGWDEVTDHSLLPTFEAFAGSLDNVVFTATVNVEACVGVTDTASKLADFFR